MWRAVHDLKAFPLLGSLITKSCADLIYSRNRFQMSTALDKYVPELDGSNYQLWSRKMKAYLQSMDLWHIVSGLTPHPVPAAAVATPEEATQILNWDISDERAQGTITLRLAPWVFDKIQVLPTGMDRNANNVWARLQTFYHTVSPSQVFALFREVLNYRVDVSRNIQPQLDNLDSLYQRLATENVEIPNFLRAMMLLAALPPSWEAPIIVTVMAGGQVAGITLESTKTTIIRYADAERARNIGKRAPKVHKISAVKHKGKTPSFPQQAAPHQGSKPQKRKDKRGQHGKGKGKGQGYGNLHFADTISRAPSTAHSVATITPRGLLQRIEVEAPDTSSFGNGPYPSFNNAMALADRLGVPKYQRNVQRLEQSVSMHVDVPGPSTFPGSAQEVPVTAPTPEGSRPSSPRSPTWPHMTQSEKDGIAPLVRFLTRTRAASAPPPVPQDVNDDEDMEDIVSLPDEEDEDPSLWGANYAPAFDPNDTGASGFDDLYEAGGDEGYVTLSSHADR